MRSPRVLAPLMVCLGLLLAALAGCSGKSGGATPRPPKFSPVGPGDRPPTTGAAVPERLLFGKVVRTNASGRFVILNFPVGRLPQPGHTFHVYRRGVKVGEVKITGPQLDDNIVADLVVGTAEPGDEVRDR